MPRIYTSASDPIDFCRKHFPTEAQAKKRYGTVGEGPDGRGDCFGYNADHPPYADDGDYRCEKCETLLSAADE